MADPYALAERFAKYLRVTDVTDGLDAVGRADVTLMDARIRPLWFGMRFWGPAVTMRVVPANQRMPRPCRLFTCATSRIGRDELSSRNTPSSQVTWLHTNSAPPVAGRLSFPWTRTR